MGDYIYMEVLLPRVTNKGEEFLDWRETNSIRDVVYLYNWRIGCNKKKREVKGKQYRREIQVFGGEKQIGGIKNEGSCK